jgi:hypothetical protein
MRYASLLLALTATIPSIGLAQPGPYKVIKTAKVGGAGGFDYVYADSAGRRLYVPRSGQGARVSVFDLDTLAPVGEIANTNARGRRRVCPSVAVPGRVPAVPRAATGRPPRRTGLAST